MADKTTRGLSAVGDIADTHLVPLWTPTVGQDPVKATVAQLGEYSAKSGFLASGAIAANTKHAIVQPNGSPANVTSDVLIQRLLELLGDADLSSDAKTAAVAALEARTGDYLAKPGGATAVAGVGITPAYGITGAVEISVQSAIGLTKRVEFFGAAGDGTTDDRAAFEAASDWLNGGNNRTIILTAGRQYRIGRRSAPYFTSSYAMEGAITILGGSGVTGKSVIFEAGAVLLMDNLNTSSGSGDQFHGICVRGPLTRVRLVSPNIKWASVPNARSQGDGIRFFGFPHDTNLGSLGDGLIRYITVEGKVTVENAPQVGGIFMGCSDIEINAWESRNTLADGLHFNACRRAYPKRVIGYNPGDDALAFVTYAKSWDITAIADNGSGLIRLTTGSAHPFATGDVLDVAGVTGTTEANGTGQPVTKVDSTHLDLQDSTFANAYVAGGVISDPNAVEGATPGVSPYYQGLTLGDFHNGHSHCNTVTTDGGGANGLRLFGAYEVTVDSAKTKGVTKGVVADAGPAGSGRAQGGVASRGCVVGRLKSKGDVEGLNVLAALTVISSDADAWWKFDLKFGDIVIHDATTLAFELNRISGVRINSCLCVNKQFGIVQCLDVGINRLEVIGATTGVVVSAYTGGVAYDGTDKYRTSLHFGSIISRNSASMEFQDAYGTVIGNFLSEYSQGGGLVLTRVDDMVIGTASVHYCNRAFSSSATSKRAFGGGPYKHVYVGALSVIHDNDVNLTSIEIGGGSSSTVKTFDFVVRDMSLITDQDASTGLSVVQGGANGPSDYSVNMRFYHTGAGTPVWTPNRLGSLAVDGKPTSAQAVTAAGAIDPTAGRVTLANTAGADFAVTLAAPGPNSGPLCIEMTARTSNNVTMALTNVVDGSAGTTCTWNSVGDRLYLQPTGNGKWGVVKESGVALS